MSELGSPVPPPGEPAHLRIKVRHHEVDPYGHVNHAHYVHYFEAGRVEILESLGLGLPELLKQGFLIVASEIRVKYLAPARAGEILEIASHVREIRGARSYWIQEIREVTSGRLCATAEVVGAFTAASGRPVRISAESAAKLAPILIPAAGVR